MNHITIKSISRRILTDAHWEKGLVKSPQRNCFTFLKISLRSGLTEESWILISASVCNLWLYVVLVKAYAENLASQRISVLRKGRVFQ